jgi:hypothetical protein
VRSDIAGDALAAARATPEYAALGLEVAPDVREHYTTAIVSAVRGAVLRSYGTALANLTGMAREWQQRHRVAAVVLETERTDRAMERMGLRHTLRELGHVMATSATDWGVHHGEARLYAVLVGWECEGDCLDPGNPEHHCDSTLWHMAARHGWTVGTVERIRAQRARIREVTR